MQLDKKFQRPMKQSKNNNEEKKRPICFLLGFGAWGVDLSFGKGDQTINSLKVEL